jgi:hypothetical protein
MSRYPALAAVALAFVVPAGCRGRTATGPARIVAPCSWSLFGDARSVAHRGHVFTGCIGIDGTTLVEDLELETGRRRLDAVFQPLEVDDHNNPGLAIFAGDLYAFSAPHSGYAFPATGAAGCATASSAAGNATLRSSRRGLLRAGGRSSGQPRLGRRATGGD